MEKLSETVRNQKVDLSLVLNGLSVCHAFVSNVYLLVCHRVMTGSVSHSFIERTHPNITSLFTSAWIKLYQ